VAQISLYLRASLASPPGLATIDGRRQRTYVACILQFEQLIQGARAISSHARPLPLYYAAMQCSRALVAAYGDSPDARGHGLTQVDKRVPGDVMQFEIKRVDKPSLFRELCAITGSEEPSSRLLLAELFLSLPELVSLPNNLSGPPAVYVERVPDPTEYEAIPDPFVHIRLETESLPDQDQLKQVYPTLQGWHHDPMERSITTRHQSALVFSSGAPIVYRDRHAALEKVAPTYRYSTDRWLRPAVASLKTPLAPLATWYALLHGFSLLARYEPAAWVQALDPQSSHAAAIDGALEEALEALPELLWKEISVRELARKQESR
jgi:hypothetical protein